MLTEREAKEALSIDYASRKVLSEIRFNTMETLQSILLLSGIMSYPPVWFVGRNGIGKTTNASYYAEIIPNTELGERFEMGGLEDSNIIDYFVRNKVKNIFVTDLERMMSRKYEIQYSTLDTIANSIDDNRGKNFTYRNRKNIDKILPQLNWAIMSTPQLFNVMFKKSWTWDFMTRFVIVPVDEIDENKGFRALYRKENIQNLIIPPLGEPLEKLGNYRHSKMFHAIKKGISLFKLKEEITVYFCQINNVGEATLIGKSITGEI